MRPCIRSRKPSSHSPTRLLIKMIHELCTNGDVTSPTSPSTVRGWMHSLSVSKPVRLMACMRGRGDKMIAGTWHKNQGRAAVRGGGVC